MSDEKLKKAEVTIRRRVECEERAFHIVNKLVVDGCVDGLYLSECGKRISQSNYDDIVEERAITKLCGYPLCNQDLPNVPKKKYHISTQTNKVYDISERKKFCSNQCFKASNIFKQQIPESPVWTREQKKIKIAISPHKGVPGLVGEEVIGERPKHDLEKELEQLEELDKRFEKKSMTKEDTSILKVKDVSGESDRSLDEDLEPKETACSSHPKENECCKPSARVDDSIEVNKIRSEFEKLDLDNPTLMQTKSAKLCAPDSNAEKEAQSSSKLDRLQKLLNKRKNVLSGMVDLQDTAGCRVNKEAQDLHGDPSNKSKVQKLSKQSGYCIEKKSTPPAAVQSPLCIICEGLKKWVSIGTVEYLQFKSSSLESMDPVTTKFSDLQIQVDCMNISKNLDTREKELRDFLGDDANIDTAGTEDGQKEMKSVPDYDALKDEAEQFELKVTEFITGKKPKQASKEKDDGTDDAVYIPPVDTQDQAQIRAKIVLERLDKFLPDLLIPMGLSVQDVSTQIRELVYTFRLERDTIIFKPAEWTLVSLLLLQMLSFRVKSVRDAFQRETTIRHISVLLKGIKNTLEDLDGLTRKLLSDAIVPFNPS